MQNKLRKLAEQWKAGDFEERECAEQLLSILDAQGDGGAVGEWRDPSTAPVSTPMEQVYFLARCPNDNWSPGGHVHFACSYGDAGRCRPVGTNGARPFNGWMPVPSTGDRPARSGGVSDADVEAVIKSVERVNTDGMDGDSWDRILVRAALTHFAKGAEDVARYRQAISLVCEGFTLPAEVRKILETSMWSKDASIQGEHHE